MSVGPCRTSNPAWRRANARLCNPLTSAVRSHHAISHTVARFDDWLVTVSGAYGSAVAEDGRRFMVSLYALLEPVVPAQLGVGVVTAAPLEFEFGTNFAAFSTHVVS